MTKQSSNNSQNGTQTAKTKPAWEVFFTDEAGRVIERQWEDKATGKRGTTWDNRGALWAGTTKSGAATLRGKVTLSDGKELKLVLRQPRERRSEDIAF